MTPDVNVLNRPLGTCERLYWLLGSACPTGFVFRTLLDRPLDVEALRRGFTRAVRRHPALRSGIVVEDGRVRFRPAEEEVSLPVVHLDADADLGAELDRQLDRPFADGGCPPLRVLWRDSSGGGSPELLWVFDHACTDAGSAARLCLEILAAAAGAEQGREAMPAPPPQESLYPRRLGGWIARIRWILRTLLERLAGLARRSPPALPGARTSGEPVRELHTTELRVERSAAEALRTRARDEGTTVHGAICAATLLATGALCEDGPPIHWPIASAVDMRPRLEPPMASDQLANAISMVATPTDVAHGDELWDLARSIRAQLLDRIERGDAHALWAAFPPDWMLPPTEKTARRLLRGMSRRPMPLIVTNIGALEHADAPVEEFSFAMGPQPNCTLVLGAVSWRGELRLCASFNRVLIGEEASRELAERLRDRLTSC